MPLRTTGIFKYGEINKSNLGCHFVHPNLQLLFIRLGLQFLATTLLCCSVGVVAEEHISVRVAEFVRNGAAFALRACDLPRRRCADRPLKVLSVFEAESNDEKRRTERLKLPGITAEVIFVVGKPTYYLSQVDLTRAEWSTIANIHVGSSRRFVIAALGFPNHGKKTSCYHYFDSEIQSEAIVCFKNDRVSHISWEYFID